MTVRRLILGAIAAVLIVVVWTSVTQPGPPEVTQAKNPHFSLYKRSIENMGRPDAQARDVASSGGSATAVLAAATSSRTCSQRCSKSCSVSCTTTRGCSSRCKAYTDGCGGAPTPERNSNVVSPTSKPASTTLEPTLASKATFTMRDLQMMLIIVGYDIAVDGELGATTQASIEHFQKAKSMAVTGEPSSDLWKGLCIEALSLAD